MPPTAGQLELQFASATAAATSLRLVRSGSNVALWRTCASRFLDQVGDHPGPTGFQSAVWIAQRIQRDALYEEAASAGLAGWLNPPVYFLSELPRLFGISARPIGLFTRRRLIGRLASEAGKDVGVPSGAGGFRGHALDSLFSELLPEGVSAQELSDALAALPADDFVTRRNAWIVRVYADYQRALAERGAYDGRAIHVTIAEAIERGGLVEAIGGARCLHIYGLPSLHNRRRLLRALAAQPDVEVSVYLPPPDQPDEWTTLEAVTETIPSSAAPPSVKPAPDAQRETRWVAGAIKRLLVDGAVEPHQIAVVARSGRDDTRRMFHALRAAGVPATARVRTPLAEISAVKMLLELLRAAATGWSYRPFRNVIASRYFRTGITTRTLDEIASRCRVEGLGDWEAQFDHLLTEARGERAQSGKRAGRTVRRLSAELEALRKFHAAVAELGESRAERAWVELTARIAAEGVFGFRARICQPIEDRWDVVRTDQRGLHNLEALLREWAGEATGRRLTAAEWVATLRSELESIELKNSTPLQRGVQVLEAHDAALTPFRRVFLIHANDGEFPHAATARGVLTDEERAALAAAGLPLAHREEALARERSLWRGVAGSEQVTVTYRTTDPNGTPLLPSLMVPDHDPSEELPRAFVPSGEAVSEREVHESLAHALRSQARAGADPLPTVATPDPVGMRVAVLAAVAERLRNEHPDFGPDRPPLPNPWNGQLRDPVVLRELARRFGPDYQWSPGTLEKYAKCPFFFFVGKVLRIEEVEEVDEETDVATFGSIAHDVLERFYRRHRDALPARLDEPTAQALETVVGDALAEWESSELWLGLPPLWAQTRESVKEAIHDFLAWELRDLDRNAQRPQWLEYAFGYGSDRELEIEGQNLHGERRALKLTGRIDRIDSAGDGARYHIIDYKSGSTPPPKGYEDGSVLQTPLYMKAVASTEGVQVVSGGFRSIRHRSSNAVLKWGDARFNRALAIAFSIPDRVRSGLFEAVHSAATRWERWEPGRDVRRSDARYRVGSRFDE